MKSKRVLSVLLVLTFIFSLNIMSALQPTIQKFFANMFSVNAVAVDDVIQKYAPVGTRDVAIDAVASASSSYTSGTGQWELARVNDGSLVYNGGEFGYNGNAGFTSSPDEIYYHPDNMTQAEKDAAVAESKTKPLWVAFDLEGFYDVSRVTLFRHGAFPDTFEIQISDDGVNYDTVTTRSGYSGFAQEALCVDFDVVRTRYIRVYVTLRGNLDGNYIHLVQLGEIAVFGKEVAATDDGLNIDTYAPENCINLAIDSKVTATESYEEGEKWGVHNINDGDTQRNGGYSSEPVNRPMSFDFKLGNIAEVKRIVVFPNGVAPSAFEIQTSYDGVNYKTVKTVSDIGLYPSSPIGIDLPATTFASYIRINVTERYASEGYYVQFAEIGVYGIKKAYDAELNKTKVKLVTGKSLQLELKVDNLNSFDPYEHKLVWESLDESIAKVDSNGLVTAVSQGETKVIVTNEAIGYSTSVDVGVYNKMPYVRDEMTVSVFAPPLGKLFTDEQYQRLADADVDLLLNTYNVYTLEDNLKLLEMAEKYGMSAIAADMRFRAAAPDVSKELVEEVYKDYSGISNLEGFYIYDEPWNPNIYASMANNIASTVPGAFIYLNLFPGFIYNSYEQYQYTADDLAALTNGNVDLMFDVYPFMQDGSTDYKILFDSLDSVRRSGLKYGVNTAACVQAIGYGPVGGELVKRIPNEQDILYQNMAYLAYGVKHVSYWKYSSEGENGVENYSVCPIDENGNPTAVYYHMQKVNPIIHTLGETLINCDAKEVYLAGNNIYGQNAVPEDFFVQSTDSSKSLILSYMSDRDTGRNYLMVVNNDLGKSVTVPLRFANGINSIQCLNNSTGTWTTSSVSGNYFVNLDAGGAALIALPDDYRYEEAKAEAGTNELYHATVYGNSSLGTPGTRDEMLPGWYLSCLTDGYIGADSSKGLNGWCSELKDESFETFVKLDLGTLKTLNSLTLHAVDSTTGYSGYFPKSFAVSSSKDGVTWTELATRTNVSVSDYMTIDFNSTDMRYIRIDVTEMNSINGKYAAALAEIETNGEVAITRFKTIAEDENGFYAYMNCVNTEYIKTPTWTDYNGQDDIIWHEGERGNWTINGFTYNFRAYIPISAHNNERGRYTVHLYAYNSKGETSKGTSFEFSSNIIFDMNYGDVSQNLMAGLDSISSGAGITASYDESTQTVTLNGTLTGSVNLQNYVEINADIKEGDVIRATLEPVSGSMTNGIIVIELFNDALANPDGKRHVADIVAAGTVDIPVNTQRAANEISGYKFWLYHDGRGQSFNNFKFRIKLEVVEGEGVYSPAGKILNYGETYGTLWQPSRDDAEFIGWFTQPEGGIQVTASTVNYGVTDVVLYARWKEIEPEFLYGLYAGITAQELEKDYLNHTNVTYKYTKVNDTEHLGSGTLVEVADNTTGKIVARYSLVIFGDINGDSWYDGQDAVYIGAIVSGMLTQEDIGEARIKAADCNHDGITDSFDYNILRRAGLLLEDVDQSLSSQELHTTSEWQTYASLIDQVPGETETPEEECWLFAVLDYIFDVLKKLFSFAF